MKFLFLCLLVYLGYRVVRSFLAPVGRPSSRPERPDDLLQVDDVMVKDPVCDTYFPKRSGVKEVLEGETLYFCSTQCRDRYLAEINKGSES